MTMTTFTVVWAFNSSNDISKAARRGDEYDQEFSRVSDVSVQLKYSAFSFFLLSVLFGFFGWKMANVRAVDEDGSRRSGGLMKRVSITYYVAAGGKLEAKEIVDFETTEPCGNQLAVVRYLLHTRNSGSGHVSELVPKHMEQPGHERPRDDGRLLRLLLFLGIPAHNIAALFDFVEGWRPPKHGPASQKLPDYGIFHIINTGEGKVLAASPLGASAYSSYGTRTEGSVGGFDREPERERPRWTHGGDLFQDPLRYDSDDGPVPSPRHFSDSYNSDASNGNYYYERVPGYSSGI
ncbi:hypothetical protein ON010_g15544 [Phytophthora cinnamomi]|nr:hypothetical protein ON010_g15544 [Phytophthora cinnamomi]